MYLEIGKYRKIRSKQRDFEESTKETTHETRFHLESINSLGRGVKTLQAGMPLMVFPEGGRSDTGELQTFAAGAAWMAIKAQVPLVPLTLIGTYELLPIHVYALHPRPLRLVVGEPISTVGFTTRDAEALTETLHRVIYETYTGAQAAHPRTL